MKVTVITINYNNAQGLELTMKSVSSQTCLPCEWVVIDGGSTDGSTGVIRRYESHLSYWVSEPDRGIYHAMNKGVAQAHGDYCIFMNSGDTFYDAETLQRVADSGATEDVVVGTVVIDNRGHIISPPPPGGELTLYHLYSGAIPHQGALIRTALLRRRPYDETLKIAADWKFFVETLILDNATIRYIDVPVARYDLGGYSSTHPEAMRAEKEQVLAALFPQRVLADYQRMKSAECLTQQLAPRLRRNYGIDRLLFRLGSLLLKLRSR